MATLNHIGIAVADQPRLRRLLEILGLQGGHEESVPSENVRTHFFPLPGKAPNLELLVPLSEQGAVAKHLAKRGPGIHHLSFEVKKGELEPLCARLAAEGYKLVYDSPRPGAHGMRINFLHPSTAGGILVELMEPGSV
jgi:methylmalonyl-CoA epimerase